MRTGFDANGLGLSYTNKCGRNDRQGHGSSHNEDVDYKKKTQNQL